ncbi:MAG: FAD-dependent oxidoreductase, partial [Lachnospiraceae bacterium]|nr:FAD-dependent oxidoreductase [Lachnospiraceae bacterium]
FSLGEKFREHAGALGTEFTEGEVIGLEKSGDIWKVTLSDGTVLESKAVIYAAGASPKTLGIKGEAEFTGRGVSYCALCDGAFFEGKAVAVIGGGDTALSDALYLSGMAEKVYLIHRRDEFRGEAKQVEKLKTKENIEFVLNSTITELVGDDELSGVKVLDKVSGESRLIEVDGLFIAIGQMPETAAFAPLITLDGAGYIVAGEDCKTNVEGIFAAGDCRTKTVRQLTTAAADGAVAALAACAYID